MKLWIVVLSEYNVRIVMSIDGPVTIFPIYLTCFSTLKCNSKSYGIILFMLFVELNQIETHTPIKKNPV